MKYISSCLSGGLMTASLTYNRDLFCLFLLLDLSKFELMSEVGNRVGEAVKKQQLVPLSLKVVAVVDLH